MDTSEKILVFDSLKSLTQEIERDMSNRDIPAQRYPVRYIMLNNFTELKELAKFMVQYGVEFLDLDNLIDNGANDMWITKDDLKNALKACEKSTFVTPFSELVRFYNDDEFRGFFNEITLLEDIHHDQKRIYIPLIGLQNRFTKFLNSFARLQESAPIWRYDAEPQSVEVYVARGKDFEVPAGTVQCQISSVREWLKFWKTQAPQTSLICTSRTIFSKHQYSKPDNIFNFTKIESAHAFMTQFLGLSFPFDYKDEDKVYWEELLRRVDKNKLKTFSFEVFVRDTFNKKKFDASDIITDWSATECGEFGRWLLKNFVQHTSFADRYPYLNLCMESIISLRDDYELKRMIATRILYNEYPENKREEYAKERRQIMMDNHLVFEKSLAESDQMWLFERIREIFKEPFNLSLAVDICTGLFDFEKKLLMGWQVHYPDNKKLQTTIEKLYPEYLYYRATDKPSQFNSANQWCIDYFRAYKQAKMEDRYTDTIAKFIKAKNGSSADFMRWYYEFKSSHELLAEMRSNIADKPDRVYWIDGLGVEFLSYIQYCIEQENSNMKVIRTQITHSELPTSTHHNRFEGCDVKKFGALDELGHDSHGYKQYETLILELKVIKNIVHEIISSAKQDKCTIAIVSDHGLSCLSRKVSSKKYDGKFEHEGRYIKTTDDAQSDADYLVHKNVADGVTYKVAMTHSSLSKVPTHQVHGGCTPEEVLVPFILVSNKGVASSIHYQIKVSAGDIMLSDPRVEISVIPEPTGVALRCEGKEYKMERVGTKWNARLEGITEGAHSIEIKPDGAESKELNINIVGIAGNTDINDLMDF